jgi:hypothetical protein
MSKTTQKTTKTNKRFDWKKIRSTIEHGFRTAFVTGKIVAFASGASYLIASGITQNNVVFMGLGAVIGAYAIIVLVSTAHTATDRTA